jgi:hypothetical protein
MKKINLYNADRKFSEEVAEYTVKGLWRYEYKLHLEKAVEKEEASIKGLENCKGSAIMTDGQIDLAIKEKLDKIAALKESYAQVISFWCTPEVSSYVKDAYKKYASGSEWAAEMLSAWTGVVVNEDTDIVRVLEDAVRGDSASNNTRQLVNTGIASMSARTKSEFTKIVYRRLFDFCVEKNTIRFVGNVVSGAGEDVAELLVETPAMTAAKLKKKAKSAK